MSAAREGVAPEKKPIYQHIAMQFVNQKIRELFPEEVKAAEEHKKFSEVTLNLISNGLAHGFIWGLQFASGNPEFDGDLDEESLMKGYDYVGRVALPADEKPTMAKAVATGFKNGAIYGLAHQP